MELLRIIFLIVGLKMLSPYNQKNEVSAGNRYFKSRGSTF